MEFIDLRSDTVTKPCAEMRKIIAEAEVGDDVYGEDPTINKLEEIAAKKFNKEAALFVTSGTMGNQIAVLTHTARGDEAILEASSHIYRFEVGGIAMLAGVLPNPVEGKKGKITPEGLKGVLQPENIHYPTPTLLCLENSSNFGGGTVYSLSEMDELVDIARDKDLKVHIDGARIFNAAAFLGIGVEKLSQRADTVMFCLSKGLGAPVGSILVGSEEFIAKARKYRKMLGGGIRQGGILAAAGIYALENLVERLVDDHILAAKIAQGINDIPGLKVDLENVQTNIIMVDIIKPNLLANDLANALNKHGVLVTSVNDKRIRLVTHRGITAQDVNNTLKVFSKVLE